MTRTYDIILIGGGSAGLTGARFAARLGARVAIAEKNRIGGDCTWTGCVPSKALLRASKAAHEVREAGRFGIESGEIRVDMAQVKAHVMGAVHTVYDQETPDVLAAEGIDVVHAPAQFVDSGTLQAGDLTLKAGKYVICTGAKPSIPPIPGLSDVPYHTHETIFENDRLPKHLLVIGAGPIGIELAFAYRRLGARVTILAAEFMPAEDPEVRQFILDLVASEGIHVVLGAIAEVTRQAGEIAIHCNDERVCGDMLLVATGRQANVEGLGLDAAGVQLSGAGGIVTDAYLTTSAKNIYAAGDVLGGLQFTHLAGWQCFQAVRNALLPGRAPGNPEVLPKVTFLDPEIASVGLLEHEARIKFGSNVEVLRRNMRATDRAIADDAPRGFIKVVSRAGGKILGVSIVSDRAGEMLAEFVLAMENGLGVSDLSKSLHSYPTWSTAIQDMAAEKAIESFLESRTGRLGLFFSRLRGH